MSFRNFACWSAEDAAAMLKTEALETSRSVFMAVHTPLSGFEVEGMQAGLMQSPDDVGLLDALTGPEHRHMFCVIQGEPGSGKSHLVRWLHFQWPGRRPDDLVLMVPRSQGSLEGALRHMREHLPAEYRVLFAHLGQTRETTLAGRARDFHARLANSLAADYFDKPRLHSAWAADNQLSRLVAHHEVREKWSTPQRILETLSGDADRNSRIESITYADVLELARLLRANRDRSIGTRAIMARRKFEREAAKLASLFEASGADDSIDEEAAQQAAPMLSRLREALDARFDAVVQDLVGVGRDGLVRAFRALRRRLAEDGRRLVLLLEDITSFQGVDSQLLDVLVARSDTEGDDAQCDLLGVVGITTDFFDRSMRSYGNLRERIGLHVQLGDANSGQLASGLSLAEPGGRQRFVANYLRAIRAGVESIDRWDASDGAHLPNRCVRCPHRTPCHRGFDATADGIGFYPLSPAAIDRIYEDLEDPQGTMSLRTPRALVQNVLSPLLLYPQHLEAGRYPPANLEAVAYLPAEKGRLLGQIRGIPDMLDAAEDRERMRRFIAWWSSTTASPRTTRDARGRSLFADIPAEGYAAFDLPWPGGDVDSAPTPAPDASTIAPNAQPSDAPSSSEAVEAPATAPTSSTEVKQDTHPVRTPSTATQTPGPARNRTSRTSKASMSRLRTEVDAWGNGENVGNSKRWSKMLVEILDALPWTSMGVPYWLRTRLFTDSTVVLEGTRRGSVRHFVIPREKWVSAGLDAWLTLRTGDQDLNAEEREFARRRTARFLRRLRDRVLAHVHDRTLVGVDGTPWNPAATAVCALLARAWLQGRIAVDASLAEQWALLLGPDEGTPDSASGRVQSWQELVQRVSRYATGFQTFVGAWIQLTLTPDRGSEGIVDAGEVAPALVGLARRLEVHEPPDAKELPTQLALWTSIAEIGGRVARLLPALPRYEVERITRTAAQLEAACDQRSLPQYLREVEQIASELPEIDAHMPRVELQRVHQALDALRQKGLLDDSENGPLRRLDDFLAEIEDERAAPPEDAPVKRLAWALTVPDTDLSLTARHVGEVEAALTALQTHVALLVSGAGSAHGDTPEALAALGARITAAADHFDQADTEEAS